MEFLRFITASVIMLVLFSYEPGKRGKAHKDNFMAPEPTEKDCREEMKALLVRNTELFNQNVTMMNKNNSLVALGDHLQRNGAIMLGALEGKYIISAEQMDSARKIFGVSRSQTGSDVRFLPLPGSKNEIPNN